MRPDYKNWMPKGMVLGTAGIDTTNGMFMSGFEALWMELSGSTLLVGRK